MEELNLIMENKERWWGGDVALGGLMPLHPRTIKSFDLEHVSTENQATTLFLSNRGRFVWCEKGFELRSVFGRMTFRSDAAPLVYREGFGNLRGAFLSASQEFFPPDGKRPADALFTRPAYSTWVALGDKMNENSLLGYAEGILKAGMPAGTLVVDNGWQRAFGDWDFHPDKFPDPKTALERLRRMGFEIMLWVSPFVSKRAPDYEYLKKNSMLLRDSTGGVSRLKRQRGSDALLDFSNPRTPEWFREKLDALKNRYPNFVGIKQDAGDPKYYYDDAISYGGVSANEQARLWAGVAEEFPYNELRASVNFGGHGVMQRQMDKLHSWGNVKGLRSLIPCAMLQGIMGYPFLIPDMVGGGKRGNFRGLFRRFADPELFIRSAEVAALMPSIQFSYPVWQLRRKKAQERVFNALKLREEFAPYLLECAENAAKTGEPIVRIMEYDFPDEGLEDVVDQFMLGERYLVAPVVRRNRGKKIVSLPTGTWTHLNDGQIYRGDQDIEVNAPLGVLPVFERQ